MPLLSVLPCGNAVVLAVQPTSGQTVQRLLSINCTRFIQRNREILLAFNFPLDDKRFHTYVNVSHKVIGVPQNCRQSFPKFIAMLFIVSLSLKSYSSIRFCSSHSHTIVSIHTRTLSKPVLASRCKQIIGNTRYLTDLLSLALIL